jgi:hypothetical protein
MTDETREQFRLPRTMQEAREMRAHKMAVVQDIVEQLDPKKGRKDDGSAEFGRWKVSATTARSRYTEEIEKIDNWIRDQQDLSLINLLGRTRAFIIGMADSGVPLGEDGYEIVGELKNHEKRMSELYGKGDQEKVR